MSGESDATKDPPINYTIWVPTATGYKHLPVCWEAGMADLREAMSDRFSEYKAQLDYATRKYSGSGLDFREGKLGLGEPFPITEPVVYTIRESDHDLLVYFLLLSSRPS